MSTERGVIYYGERKAEFNHEEVGQMLAVGRALPDFEQAVP